MKKLIRKYMPLFLFVIAGILYFIGDYFMDLPPTALVFQSEVVRADCEDARFRIEGEYRFLSPHPRRRTYEMGFPFLDEDVAISREDIRVSANDRAIEFRILSQGIMFDLPVERGKETILKISYTLPAPDRMGIYITKTANLWPEPVTRAEFVIPQGARSNYHKTGELSAVFYKFKPKENWKIAWE